MTKLEKPNGVVLAYRYDGLGRRVQSVRTEVSFPTRLTTWGYDGQQVAALWKNAADQTPALVETFVTSPSGDPLQATRTNPAQGEAGTVFPVLDGLGSVTAVLDGVGAVESRTSYTAFGTPVPGVGSNLGRVGLDGVYAYTGHAWEQDAGQYYARARWLDSSTGRFTGEDPIHATNMYEYVGNQPFDYVDPSGAMAVEVVGVTQFGAEFAKAAQYIAVPGFGALTLLAQFIGMAKNGFNSACAWDSTVTASFWTITFAELAVLRTVHISHKGWVGLAVGAATVVAYLDQIKDYAESLQTGGSCNRGGNF